MTRDDKADQLFEVLLQALVEQEASHEQLQQLADFLRRDEARQRRYVEYLNLHAMLQWEHAPAPHIHELPELISDNLGVSTALGNLFDEAEWLRLHPGEVKLYEARLRRESAGDATTRVRRRISTRWLALAATFVLAATAALALMLARPGATASDTPLATFARSRNAVVTHGSEPVRLGDRMPSGPLQLTQGVARIDFRRGAQVVIESPAAFEIKGDNELFVQRGRLSATVPAAAHGFVVRTDHLIVTDLGTEFAVATGEDDAAAVHVFVGSVEVRLLDSAGKLVQTRTITANKAESFDPVRATATPIELSSDRFLRSMDEPTSRGQAASASDLRITPAYGQAVLADRPLAYWRFEQREGDLVGNEAGPQHPARLVGGVDLAGSGDNHTAQFGFGERAIEMPQGLDELHGRDYSLELWIRPDFLQPAAALGLYLPLNRHQALIELRSDGRVRFLHRSPPGAAGGTDIYSSVPYVSERWQHIVAVKAGGDMSLYLDGQLVGTARDRGALLPGSHVIIGRLLPPSRHADVRQYSGAIDEVAIYPHALTPDAIRRHFELARPR